MYVFTNSTLKYLLKELKSKIALKSELDNKVDKVDGKDLSDNDFTDTAKQSLENKYASVEANYSTGMTHIKFSNENQSNTKTINLKTGCDMFFYPTIDAELVFNSDGNVTIPYAFISRSGSDIGKVTVNIENLTENIHSENIFNVTDNGNELVLENILPGDVKLSFTIEGDTEELKANVLGEYSTVIMSLLTIYRSTDASLVPSNNLNTKTVVSDFGNGEYEIMLYTATKTNHLNFSNAQTLTNVSYISNDITTMYNTYRSCRNLTGSPVCGSNVTNMSHTYYYCWNLTGSPVCGNNVNNMYYTYYDCYRLTGAPACGDKVINMYNAYFNCRNLTGSPVCGNNVTNMSHTYQQCRNLTGSPACGPNVTDMYYAYHNCNKLTGPPACGPNVINMSCAYPDCQRLTGSPVCGDKVTNMYNAYLYCLNLTGSPVCGPNVTNMAYAYTQCINLTGNPVCGPNVTDMNSAYFGCRNLYGDMLVYSNNVSSAIHCFFGRNISKQLNIVVNFGTISYNSFRTNNTAGYGETWTNAGDGSIYCWNDKANIVIFNMQTTNMANAFKSDDTISKAACGPNVTDMSSAYSYCHNLAGSPVCGPNVTDMSWAYTSCDGLTGSPVCGNKVTNFSSTYYGCTNLTGSPVCGANVENMDSAYESCDNLTGSPVCGNNVKSMRYTYLSCANLTGNPVCGNNVTDMEGAYYYCYNLKGSPVCGPNVTTMTSAYCDCYNLTGSPVCGNNVIDMSNTYLNCTNLTGSPVCGDKVTNMANTYYGCINLTGASVCGPNVTNMFGTYSDCRNLTGDPVCGDKVTDMCGTYLGCINLTGSPVCGPNVIDMSGAYYDCTNLTGNPACGPNVTDMYATYWECHNLTGSPVCGNNVIGMYGAYYNCPNLSSNGYFYSNKVTDAWSCFGGRNTNARLNLYVPTNSTTLTTCLCNDSLNSLTGTDITWSSDTANSRYYNTAQNIYICPVANVEQIYKDNELLIARYTMNSGANVVPQVDSATMITTEDITNNNGTITRSVYLDASQVGELPSSISFNGATDLLTVEKLKIDNITDTSYMFNGCSNLTSVCVSDWDTNKITKADYMFAGCSKLTKESFEKTYYDLKYESDTYTLKFNEEIKLFDYPSSEFNFITLDYPMTEFEEGYSRFDPQIERSNTYECTYYTFGNIESIVITAYDDGSIYAYTNGPGGDIKLYFYNKYKYIFELPNVESASHIFDGCTNLL